MSLCLLIQEEDRIIIGADSRESITINGEKFATGRNIRKIRVIGDLVIFSTGSAYVAGNILEEFEASGDWSIENLERIKDKHVELFAEQHGSRYFGDNGYDRSHVIGFVICSFREGKSVVQAMSSKDSEVFNNVGSRIKLADGARGPEALEMLKKHQQTEVVEAYKLIYSALADERIGGILSIFLIDKHGIKHGEFPIIDNREIKIADAHLMWTREHGLIIEREDHVSKVTMNSDEMKWEVNGEKKLHYDAIENRLKFGGTLEAADGIFSGDLSAVGGTFTGTLVGVDGTFSGMITASSFLGGSVTGSLIQTQSSYPRSEMNAAGNFFGAYASAGNYIEILANRLGQSYIRMVDGATEAGIGYRDSNGLIVTSDKGITLTSVTGNISLLPGSFVVVQSFNTIYNAATGKTLQQTLDEIAAL